jgi:hypothetical protein
VIYKHPMLEFERRSVVKQDVSAESDRFTPDLHWVALAEIRR